MHNNDVTRLLQLLQQLLLQQPRDVLIVHVGRISQCHRRHALPTKPGDKSHIARMPCCIGHIRMKERRYARACYCFLGHLHSSCCSACDKLLYSSPS